MTNGLSKARLYLLKAITNIYGLLRCDTMQFGKEEPAMLCHEGTQEEYRYSSTHF